MKNPRKPLSLRGKSVGWIVGLEPTASRATIWRASQLRHTHHISHLQMISHLHSHVKEMFDALSLSGSEHYLLAALLTYGPSAGIEIEYRFLFLFGAKCLSCIYRLRTLRLRRCSDSAGNSLKSVVCKFLHSPGLLSETYYIILNVTPQKYCGQRIYRLNCICKENPDMRFLDRRKRNKR